VRDEDKQAREAPERGEESVEELLEQAQANAQAAVIATVGFLRAEGVPLERWTTALGRTFARGWDEPQPWEAGEFMEAMLTNFRSIGAEVRSATLAPDRAEAVIASFPDEELCALFAVPAEDVAHFLDATAVIAAERGLRWSWERDGEETRCLAERTEG
jgi:hypothetical protein